MPGTSRLAAAGIYGADLHLYSRRGYPTVNATTQEELTLKAFIRGLQLERL